MQKQKILIVDDRMENLISMELLLEELNVECVKALSGNEALQLTLDNDFALALVDVQMPEMDGFETVELMRKVAKTRYLPVIFVSAIYSENYYKLKGVNAGAVDFITKPIQPQILLGKVKIFLDLDAQKIKLQETVSQLEDALAKVKSLTGIQEKTLVKLREANATKDKFFSIIAHDLKNPIIVFQTGLEMLEEHLQGSDDEFSHKIMSELNKKSNHLNDLLNNLLTWARTQKGSVPYAPQITDIYHSAAAAIRLLQPNAEQKNITIDCKIEQGTLAFADNNMVETIIRNLLSNAIKFSTKGGTIELSAKGADKFLEIAISDNGIGMTIQQQRKLFNIGEHNNSQLGTEGETGTGLGLILCKEFVEKHGGKIWVESELDKKTTFTFTLPREEN